MRKITSLLIMAVLCLTLSGCYATGLLELANLSGLTPQSYTLSPSQTTFYFDEYPYYDEDYDPADYDEYVSVSYDEYPDEYLDEYLYDEGLSGYYAAEIVNTLQFPVKIEAINIDFMGTDGSSSPIQAISAPSPASSSPGKLRTPAACSISKRLPIKTTYSPWSFPSSPTRQPAPPRR